MPRMSESERQTLEVVAANQVEVFARLRPPSELTKEQEAEFLALVNSLPAQSLVPANLGLLVQYVRHRVMARRFNAAKTVDKVFCYVGGGWYWPGQTIADLQEEMRRHLGDGYTMVKMKVGGLPLEEDVRRVEAVRQVVQAPNALAVDANSKFARDEALAYAKALAPFGLRWFEEPCDPLDYALLAEIASVYAPPLATGENLFSTQDVENLARFGALRADRDVIQIDPPQAYGIVQYGRTVAMLERRGWQRASLFPHGGNQMSLAIAGGFGLGGAESYPGVFGDFGGFADDAKLADGYLTLSDRPGIGLEGQSALYLLMRELAEV